ncbi:MAG TPA: hypothetical protein VK134_04315, partial [Ktedonobacteraceae bacterium]|nr:hypothetical protein [Ktedonobacteraceae bacterium]
MSNVPPLELSRLFLEEAYESLGFLEAKDALLNAVSHPEPGTDEGKEWLEKGDWLALATKVG